ncbi:MAG: hypothetical protein LBS01_02990 [Prevotellaceae bacterium]|jgi:hypothetical protein|nr:hypothetical protein [Prevotellaceae bacterium]
MAKKIIKDGDKGTKLISVLSKNLDGKMNKARIKFLGFFICALCKVQTVSFQKLASAFESAAQSDSSLRRIQRFMAACNLTGERIEIMNRFIRLFGKDRIDCLTADREFVGEVWIKYLNIC